LTFSIHALINGPNKYLSRLVEVEVFYGSHLPGGKIFENTPKFKSSPQNNSISAAFLKQMLCGTSMYSKYLSKYNIKN
jgi:hypothetical protein